MNANRLFIPVQTRDLTKITSKGAIIKMIHKLLRLYLVVSITSATLAIFK